MIADASQPILAGAPENGNVWAATIRGVEPARVDAIAVAHSIVVTRTCCDPNRPAVVTLADVFRQFADDYLSRHGASCARTSVPCSSSRVRSCGAVRGD